MDNIFSQGGDRKRLPSPQRNRHFKRMIVLDEHNDDWRRATLPPGFSATPKASTEQGASANSVAAKGASASANASGSNELNLVTEKFSGFLADFLAEYSSPSSPRPFGSTPSEALGGRHPAQQQAADGLTISDSGSSMTDSPAPETWRSSGSQDTPASTQYTSESGMDESDNASTVADTNESWQDGDLETPESPGSEIDLQDDFVRPGTYITVIMRHPDQPSAIPCTAKVLRIHDRRGKFTVRLSKSSRRTARAMLGVPCVDGPGPRSPTTPRGRLTLPRG